MGVKRLYATLNTAEAQRLRALLKDQGIDATLEADGGIHVRDEDAPAAAEALARHFEKETGAEAAPPPEESAALEAKARRRVYGKRLFLLLILFWPGILYLAWFFDEPWKKVTAGAAGVLSLVAFIWVVGVIAENKTGPSPESGDGPVDDSSKPT